MRSRRDRHERAGGRQPGRATHVFGASPAANRCLSVTRSTYVSTKQCLEATGGFASRDETNPSPPTHPNNEDDNNKTSNGRRHVSSGSVAALPLVALVRWRVGRGLGPSQRRAPRLARPDEPRRARLRLELRVEPTTAAWRGGGGRGGGTRRRSRRGGGTRPARAGSGRGGSGGVGHVADERRERDRLRNAVCSGGSVATVSTMRRLQHLHLHLHVETRRMRRRWLWRRAGSEMAPEQRE
mmetsp:Transcript_37085/g.86647  ORF Transcript_37085/g.86647 Transcript_37085/m.86647 type:complete len:240 (-) Transcript_37085:1501-2220(-)